MSRRRGGVSPTDKTETPLKLFTETWKHTHRTPRSQTPKQTRRLSSIEPNYRRPEQTPKTAIGKNLAGPRPPRNKRRPSCATVAMVKMIANRGLSVKPTPLRKAGYVCVLFGRVREKVELSWPERYGSVERLTIPGVSGFGCYLVAISWKMAFVLCTDWLWWVAVV